MNSHNEKITVNFEIEKAVWEKFKSTVPHSLTLEEAVIAIIKQRVKEIEEPEQHENI